MNQRGKSPIPAIFIGKTLWLAGPVLLSVLCLLAPPDLGADERSDREAELAALGERISTLQDQIQGDINTRDALRERLAVLERRIAGRDRELHLLKGRLAAQQRALIKLQRQRRQAQLRLQQQRRVFGDLVYTTYVMGREHYLKLLLNQEDPARLGRAMTLYRYLAQDRVDRIDRVHALVRELSGLESGISDQTQELRRLQGIELRGRQGLATFRDERRQLLTRIDQRIEAGGVEISRLRANAARLERLLKGLQDYIEALPATAIPGQRFADMKGKLALPVDAEISAYFGQPKLSGALLWDGLFFRASEGQEVRAVYRGRVVFSDWLRGFGLLLILEHGDGYMSVYSHNQLLYKEVGDWVETTESIARVGESGGLSQPGLYFEVRQNGKPRDPLFWVLRD